MQPAMKLPESAVWFKLLTPEQQERVLQAIVTMDYPEGALVERKGEKANAWLGVASGLVKVSVSTPDGKTASLTGVPAGGWIGEGSLLKNEIRKFDVVALRDCTVFRVPETTFNWLLDSSIAFNRYLLHQLNEQIGRASCRE